MGLVTIDYLSEQVIRLLSGGDRNMDDSEWDIREINLFVSQAANYFIKQNLFQNFAEGEKGLDGQYIATFYDVPVQFDSKLNLAYSVLPAKYIALPHDRGLQQISPMQDQWNVFMPIRSGAMALFKNSPAGRLEGRLGFFPEGGKVFYTKDISNDIPTVLVKLIVAGADDVSTSVPFIPAEIELPIIEKVFELLRHRLPQDKINNNNPQN